MPSLPVGSDPAAFWTAFLANLYSGLLYSLATGFTVGIAVWLVQRSSDKRRIRNDYRRDLDLLRQKLRTTFQLDMEIVNLESAGNASPPVAQVACKAMETYPLALWHQDLKGERPFIAALRQLQFAVSELAVTGARLDAVLANLVRRHNAGRDIIEVNDRADQMFFRGRRLYGLNGNAILPAMDMSAHALPRFEASYTSVGADAELNRLADAFVAKREALRRAIKGSETS